MLSAEKIQSNWDRYLNEIKTNISKERSDIIIPFLNKGPLAINIPCISLCLGLYPCIPKGKSLLLFIFSLVVSVHPKSETIK